MEIKRENLPRTIFFLVTTISAIVIFSLTIGKDWYEGRDQTIQSFAIVHFAGYLFFLLMPVEMSFIYCVASHHTVLKIIGIAMGTALTAQLIDYTIGYFISSSIIHRYFSRKKSARAESFIYKYGDLTIFLFNLLPLSSPIVCLAAGMIRYPLGKVVLYSFAGLAIKYVVLGFCFV